MKELFRFNETVDRVNEPLSDPDIRIRASEESCSVAFDVSLPNLVQWRSLDVTKSSRRFIVVLRADFIEADLAQVS